MKMSMKVRKRNRLHELCVGMSCLVIFMLLGTVFWGQVTYAIDSIISPQSIQIFNYQVGAGDTLWMLASKTTTQEEDVRDKIIAIRKLNGLSASQSLVPGQIIKIPVKRLNDSGLRYTYKIQ